MITKKRKLAAIKKQMDSVRGGPVRHVKFTDVVNDALTKLKKASSLVSKLGSSDLELEKVLEWLINDISIDKKIVDFLLDIYTKANIFDGAISTEKVAETIDKTQYALELMNMYQINNLKIENSVERMPFVKAIQILQSMEEKESEKIWDMMSEKSNDKRTVDFKDMCVWIVSK